MKGMLRNVREMLVRLAQLQGEADATIPKIDELLAASPEEKPIEPVAWMWQHGETGNCGFIEHCSEADRAHWERMNKPRQIITPLYRHPSPQKAPFAQADQTPAFGKPTPK